MQTSKAGAANERGLLFLPRALYFAGMVCWWQHKINIAAVVDGVVFLNSVEFY